MRTRLALPASSPRPLGAVALCAALLALSAAAQTPTREELLEGLNLPDAAAVPDDPAAAPSDEDAPCDPAAGDICVGDLRGGFNPPPTPRTRPREDVRPASVVRRPAEARPVRPPPEIARSRPDLLEVGRVSVTINFDLNSARLRPDSLDLLRVICDVLGQERVAGAVYRVAGHTDLSGSRATNLELSEARAATVRQWLTGRDCRLDSGLLYAEGYGPAEPLPGLDPYDPANRRVEIARMLPAAALEPAPRPASRPAVPTPPRVEIVPTRPGAPLGKEQPGAGR